jgi:hypothetical protein
MHFHLPDECRRDGEAVALVAKDEDAAIFTLAESPIFRDAKKK